MLKFKMLTKSFDGDTKTSDDESHKYIKITYK